MEMERIAMLFGYVGCVPPGCVCGFVCVMIHVAVEFLMYRYLQLECMISVIIVLLERVQKIIPNIWWLVIIADDYVEELINKQSEPEPSFMKRVVLL